MLIYLISLFVTTSGIAQYTAQFDSIFSEYSSIEKPGVAVSVIQNDSVIYSKGFGGANLEYNLPITTSSVFHVASVSKQFTVFSILLLEEQGILSLDDDIRKYIPEVPDFGETITLRHLANHTSGLRDQWYLLGLAGWKDDDIKTTDEILRLIAHQKELNFKPGEEHAYCNTGYTLLAEVVARVSHMSFRDFTQANIFTPLKMINTQFNDDHHRIIPNKVYSYSCDSSEYEKSLFNNESVGATNLCTTVEDMALWALNFSDIKVGSSKIFDKMNSKTVLNNGDSINVGLGQFFYNYRGLNEIYHEGMDAGYRAYFSRFPDWNFSVIVFSNCNITDPYKYASEIIDIALREHLEKPITEENTNIDTNKEYIDRSTLNLKEFTGLYYSEELQTTYEIEITEDHLEVKNIRIGEIEIYPVSKDLFQDAGEWANSKFQFIRNEKNKVIEMRFSSEHEDRIRNLKFTKQK